MTAATKNRRDRRAEGRLTGKEIRAFQERISNHLKALGLESAADAGLLARLREIVATQNVQVPLGELAMGENSPSKRLALSLMALADGLVTGRFIVVKNPLVEDGENHKKPAAPAPAADKANTKPPKK